MVLPACRTTAAVAGSPCAAARALAALRAASVATRGASQYESIRCMAYDEALASRIRELLADEPDVVERRMFGGLAFLVDGHLAVAASGSGGLMARCEPEQTDALVAEAHAQVFEMRGRAMRGWLRVDAEGVGTDQELGSWVRPAVGYARSLPD